MKGTILEKIVDAKRFRVEAAKRAAGGLEPVSRQPGRRLGRALADRAKTNIIAEFKRASPSKGVINRFAGPGETAAAYAAGGAAAISVLTEEDFFQGSLDDLQSVRDAVEIPVLRKDFIVDEFQIHESAAAGADAVLLIVAALKEQELRDFQALAHEFGLDALIEVHNEEELEIAGSIGSRLIGVNNRNLHTFEVTLDVSRRLAQLAPKGAVLVSESGIRTRADIIELSELGYSGFLIGETLMRSGDPRSELRILIGEPAEGF